jgi:hypothetical protein
MAKTVIFFVFYLIILVSSCAKRFAPADPDKSIKCDLLLLLLSNQELYEAKFLRLDIADTITIIDLNHYFSSCSERIVKNKVVVFTHEEIPNPQLMTISSQLRFASPYLNSP